MNSTLNKLPLSTLLVGSLLLVGILPVIISSISSLSTAQHAMRNKAFNNLESVRSVKQEQLTEFLDDRRSDMSVLSEMVNSFYDQSAYNLDKDVRDKAGRIQALVSQLETELSLFSQSYDTKEAIKAFSQSFQPNEAVKDNARWRINDSIFGAHVETYRTSFDWHDALLLNVDGDIIYSAAKLKDLGLNVSDSTIASSGLNEAFTKAQKQGSGNKAFWGDVSYYPPADEFSAFLVEAVTDSNRQGKLLGYVALRLPVERVDQNLVSSDNEASVNEYTFLVGPDKKLRSNAPFLTMVESHKNSEPLNIYSVESAQDGSEGMAIARNYNNQLVMTQWKTVRISEDLSWILVGERTIERALVPVDKEGVTFYERYANLYGYYDVLLVEPQGEIFHTVEKEQDLNTNVFSGPYSNSNLASLIKRVSESKRIGIADFARYSPSGDAPSSFLATPIYDQKGAIKLYVALQLSLEAINNIMHLDDGMGETSETYLVGEDFRMRSDSMRSASSHSVNASFAGTVEKNGMNTEAVKSALGGHAETREVLGYRGEKTLSSFNSIHVDGFNWAIVTEIESNEAFADIAKMQFNTWVTLGISIIFISFVAIYLSGIIKRPLGGEPLEMMELANQVAQGKLTNTFSNNTREGTIYSSLREMSLNLRALIKHIVESSQLLTTSAQDSSNVAVRTTQAIKQQHQNIELVATAVNQMNVSFQEVATSSASASQSSRNAKEKSIEGIELLNEGNQQIEQLVVDMRDLAKEMEQLKVSSANIDQVITVIHSISEQTNLLALNAAIEAARAGEQGRGFAVVADEVRVLAQKAQDSATDIQTMVMTLQQAANKSISGMEKNVLQVEEVSQRSLNTSKTFEQINDAVTQIDEMMDQIATATEEQSQVTGDIAKRIEEISESSIETATSTNQLMQTSSSVAQSAEELSNHSKKFQV
ncbi:methyl-accepting chemotaxis protein [Vibrio sp. NH-UV-68]|uniref:methyl-accepting chemotaxis protein n=1 Tax=unclassified Vibrio TaxID=2614977 RepID=UPI0036F3DFB2